MMTIKGRIKDLCEKLCEQGLNKYLESEEEHVFKRNMTLCDFHEDHHESMYVDNENGELVLYCYAYDFGVKKND